MVGMNHYDRERLPGLMELTMMERRGEITPVQFMEFAAKRRKATSGAKDSEPSKSQTCRIGGKVYKIAKTRNGKALQCGGKKRVQLKDAAKVQALRDAGGEFDGAIAGKPYKVNAEMLLAANKMGVSSRQLAAGRVPADLQTKLRRKFNEMTIGESVTKPVTKRPVRPEEKVTPLDTKLQKAAAEKASGQSRSVDPDEQARYVEARLAQTREDTKKTYRTIIEKDLANAQTRLADAQRRLDQLKKDAPKFDRPVNANGYLIPREGDTVIIPANTRGTSGMAGLFRPPTAIVNPGGKTMTVSNGGASQFRQGQRLSLSRYDVTVEGDPRAPIARQEREVEEATQDVRRSEASLLQLDQPDKVAEEADRSVVASARRYAQEGFNFLDQDKDPSLKAGDEIVSVPLAFPEDASREKITRTQDGKLFSVYDGEEYEVSIEDRKDPGYALFGVKTGSAVPTSNTPKAEPSSKTPDPPEPPAPTPEPPTPKPANTPQPKTTGVLPASQWKGTTGDPQLDQRLESLRAKKLKTRGDELQIERLERLQKLNPNSWNEGQGVGIRVIADGRYSQVNRGAQIVEVDRATKTALVRYVADIGGLTGTGGDEDPRAWKAQRISLADLVRDNQYSRPE